MPNKNRDGILRALHVLKISLDEKNFVKKEFIYFHFFVFMYSSDFGDNFETESRAHKTEFFFFLLSCNIRVRKIFFERGHEIAMLSNEKKLFLELKKIFFLRVCRISSWIYFFNFKSFNNISSSIRPRQGFEPTTSWL